MILDMRLVLGAVDLGPLLLRFELILSPDDFYNLYVYTWFVVHLWWLRNNKLYYSFLFLLIPFLRCHLVLWLWYYGLNNVFNMLKQFASSFNYVTNNNPLWQEKLVTYYFFFLFLFYYYYFIFFNQKFVSKVYVWHYISWITKCLPKSWSFRQHNPNRECAVVKF